MREAIEESGFAFEYASSELRANRVLILAAVKNFGYAFLYASDDLRADKDFVRQVVRYRGEALMYASKELRADRRLVIEAVRNNGLALRYADIKHQSDGILRAMAGFSVSHEELLLAAYNEFDQQNCDEILIASVSEELGVTSPDIRDEYTRRRIDQFQ